MEQLLLIRRSSKLGYAVLKNTFYQVFRGAVIPGFLFQFADRPLIISWNRIMEWRRKVPYPADIYLFKVNKRNTRARCEICSKLTIKTSEWYQWRRSGVFVANFEHISHHDLVFVLLTCNCQLGRRSWKSQKQPFRSVLWKWCFVNFS